MNEYRVMLLYKSENKLTETQVADLIPEQWEGTGAALEGDTVTVESVVQVRDND